MTAGEDLSARHDRLWAHAALRRLAEQRARGGAVRHQLRGGRREQHPPRRRGVGGLPVGNRRRRAVARHAPHEHGVRSTNTAPAPASGGCTGCSRNAPCRSRSMRSQPRWRAMSKAVAAMNEAGWEIATHGLKWIDYRDTPPEVEARHIAEAVRIHTEVAGARPLGFYQGRSSINTIRLGMEEGGLPLLRRLLCRRSAVLARRPAWAPADHALHARFERHALRHSRRDSTPATSSTPISRTRSTRSTPKARSRPKCCRSGCTAGSSAGPGRAASLARFIDYVAEPRSRLDADPARHRAPLDPQASAAGRLEAVAAHPHAVRRALRRRLRTFAMGRRGGL